MFYVFGLAFENYAFLSAKSSILVLNQTVSVFCQSSQLISCSKSVIAAKYHPVSSISSSVSSRSDWEYLWQVEMSPRSTLHFAASCGVVAAIIIYIELVFWLHCKTCIVFCFSHLSYSMEKLSRNIPCWFVCLMELLLRGRCFQVDV